MKTLYAGKSMTIWETLEEAAASWSKDAAALLERSTFPFWRADAVEVVTDPAQKEAFFQDLGRPADGADDAQSPVRR